MVSVWVKVSDRISKFLRTDKGQGKFRGTVMIKASSRP